MKKIEIKKAMSEKTSGFKKVFEPVEKGKKKKPPAEQTK